MSGDDAPTAGSEVNVSSVEWARPGVVVVALQGELDMASVPAVSQALLDLIAERPRRLVLDLGQVSFFGSMAVGMLLMVHEELAPTGWLSLIGIAGNRRVSSVLDVAGIRMLAPEYPGITAALRELDAAE